MSQSNFKYFFFFTKLGKLRIEDRQKENKEAYSRSLTEWFKLPEKGGEKEMLGAITPQRRKNSGSKVMGNLTYHRLTTLPFLQDHK